jgi:hypothetical protein
MQKIVLAAFLGASALALPAFAQSNPAGSTAAGATTQPPGSSGISTTSAGVEGSSTTDASGDSTLGLGGLLKQTQMQDASTSQAEDGAGPTGNILSAKPKAHTKVRTSGH